MRPGVVRTGSERGPWATAVRPTVEIYRSKENKKNALCALRERERERKEPATGDLASVVCGSLCFPIDPAWSVLPLGEAEWKRRSRTRAPNFHARLVIISGGGLMGLPRGSLTPTEDFMLRAELTLGIRTFAPRSI